MDIPLRAAVVGTDDFREVGILMYAAVCGSFVLNVRATVLEARRSKSKPDRGIVRSLAEVTNQHGETVMRVTAINFVLARTRSPGTCSTERGGVRGRARWPVRAARLGRRALAVDGGGAVAVGV